MSWSIDESRFVAPVSGDVEPFDAFEIATVAEYDDHHGSTFCEEVDGRDTDDEDAVSYMITLYGHFPSGGVHAIHDAYINQDFPYEQAHAYIVNMAKALAHGRPVYDRAVPR